MEEEAEVSKATTMGALGPQLPTGGASRQMEARPWRLKEEREVGNMRASMASASPGEFVAALVGFMFTRLGDANLESMKEGARALAVRKMLLGDVMYAYTWLRRQALGPEIDFTVQCPACRVANKMKASLDDLDVVEGKVNDLWEVPLLDPFPLRKTTATKLRLSQPTWEVMCRVTGRAANPTLASIEVIRAAIVGVNDDPPVALAMSDIEEMSKRDIASLEDSINSRNAGPNWRVEVKCTDCNMKSVAPLDWGYDAFFSKSSGR